MGKANNTVRYVLSLSLFISLVAAPVQGVTLNTGNERQARKKLAEKLLRLGRNLDMREASYPESGGGGGQSFDRNSGNPFTSRTTLHSTVWSRCLEWVGGQFCNRWLDPYVSLHGFGGDKSPLEGFVAQQWLQQKTPGESTGNQYAIWEVDRVGGGSNVDADGKFEMRGLRDWRLKNDVRQGSEKIGTETAVAAISSTYDDSTGPGENTMPNMESLRLMAARFTKIMRNRLVTILGESRAFSPGIEVALSEDTPTCEAYAQAVKNDPDTTGIQERIQPQPKLQPETMANTLQSRVAMCKAMRAANVYAVNPTVNGNSVVKGNINEEQVDRWKAQMGIAAIDYAGGDFEKMPKPANAVLRPEDTESRMADYNVGGRTFRMVSKSNREQIDGYNRNLQQAAMAMKEVASMAPSIRDNSSEILKYQIGRGAMTAIRINDLTPEMRGELAGTGFPRASTSDRSDPGLQPERTPSQLTVRVVGGM